ncbi:hypothetical protein BUALT_Bualt07G0131900 [Buddleja alternifolia]|uniref:GRF-type domain-containing protein n=1 Tax=Buddleja alternifolia TaxID=168488 RepID=A0AAV6XH36_9LAMI|nr:hypothetical protein BUALT_Bualt07G0131900 [Buddleja alternifolia]
MKDNTGRRFHSCKNYRNGGCKFFVWEDPPMCPRSKVVIPDLLKRLNSKDNEIDELRGSMVELKNRNANEMAEMRKTMAELQYVERPPRYSGGNPKCELLLLYSSGNQDGPARYSSAEVGAEDGPSRYSALVSVIAVNRLDMLTYFLSALIIPDVTPCGVPDVAFGCHQQMELDIAFSNDDCVGFSFEFNVTVGAVGGFAKRPPLCLFGLVLLGVDGALLFFLGLLLVVAYDIVYSIDISCLPTSPHECFIFQLEHFKILQQA